MYASKGPQWSVGKIEPTTLPEESGLSCKQGWGREEGTALRWVDCYTTDARFFGVLLCL